MWLTLLLRYWKPLAALAVLALVFASGFASGNRVASSECMRKEARATKRAMDDMARANQQTRDAVNRLRALEQQHAGVLAEVGQAYEKGKHDAERKSLDVVAGLRAGTVRLRQHWQGCEATSRASASASAAREFDAVAQVRAEAAGRIVRYGAEADAQVRGLQDVIRKDREAINGL